MSRSFKHEEITGFSFSTHLLGQSKAASHVYYVDGLLIDTGHSRKRSDVLSATWDIAVHQIFITHHHEDHTGNLGVIREEFNCPTYASEMCCELMKDPPKISLAQRLYWGDRPSDDQLTPIYDKLETDNFSFDLIPLKGHSDDMLALYEPYRKWLFSGDLFVHTRVGYYLKHESMRAQMNSIREVLKLDFDVMLCSHNPQLDKPKEALTKKLNYLEDMFENVSMLHEKGFTPKEIMKQLKLKEYKAVKFLSGGDLSKLNMVNSVIRDITLEKN